ncbi:sensor histidine kinase [Aequorivita sinensis]|uniref:sensor histidine kinase n=1 Tax=Aequorivita sinensis TaxID=1382458 RepID=UPI0023001683|nr:histidine kinase [Aequorivita sinensis]
MGLKKHIDINLLKYLALFYTIVVLLVQLKKSYWKIIGTTSYGPLSWGKLFNYGVLIDWVVVILFMTFISILTKLMFEKWGAKGWKKIIWVHVFFSFFIGYFIFFMTAVISLLIGETSFSEASRYLSFDYFVSVVEVNFLVYFAMIGIINVYYYIKKVRNIEIQKAQVETHLATAKLNMLKAQLHPHFIFNTLNSISALIEIDKEKAQNLIADFGDLFRDILDYKDENLIPLHRELALLDKYIEIISIRFSDHLLVEKDINSDVQDVLVPHMLLQPIFENAIKHGYGYNNTEIKVKLKIYKNTDYLFIEIKNNGEPLTDSFKALLHKGTGLKNTQDRLNTLYGNEIEFFVENNKSDNTVVTFMRIPLNI